MILFWTRARRYCGTPLRFAAQHKGRYHSVLFCKRLTYNDRGEGEEHPPPHRYVDICTCILGLFLRQKPRLEEVNFGRMSRRVA